MKTQKPLVSILLPVHNAERFLANCLKSLVSQSYRQIEIIAIDDASTDNSRKILKSFAKKYKKVRFYKNVKRYGLVMTMNRLLKRAKGNFIAFMDAKDISAKQRIKKQIEFMQGNPGVVALGSQCRFLNEKGGLKGKSNFPLKNHFIYESPLHGISMQFETVMVNKTLLPKDVLRFNNFSNPFIYSDVFIKILPYGKFANLDKFLHYHRRNPKTYFYDLRNNIISFIKLWLLSKSSYNYTPKLGSLLLPFTRLSPR